MYSTNEAKKRSIDLSTEFARAGFLIEDVLKADKQLTKVKKSLSVATEKIQKILDYFYAVGIIEFKEYNILVQSMIFGLTTKEIGKNYGITTKNAEKSANDAIVKIVTVGDKTGKQTLDKE